MLKIFCPSTELLQFFPFILITSRGFEDSPQRFVGYLQHVWGGCLQRVWRVQTVCFRDIRSLFGGYWQCVWRVSAAYSMSTRSVGVGKNRDRKVVATWSTL